MTAESQQGSSQPENPSLTASFPSLPSQLRNSKETGWIIAGLVIGILILCTIAYVAVFGTRLFKANKEKAPIESKLDAYMTAMANKDIERAYVLFSPRAKRQISISKLQELLAGDNDRLFEGYQGLSVEEVDLRLRRKIIFPFCRQACVGGWCNSSVARRDAV